MNARPPSLAVSFVLAACQPAAEPSGGPSREDLLKSLATEVFLPSYAQLEEKTQTLSLATTAVCANPSANTLEAARDAWRDARVPLKQAEGWSFGPIMSLNIETAIDFWPARTDAIDSAIASGATPTADWVAAQGTAAKGLPAIEYVLFPPGADDTMTLASLDGGTSASAHRCAYLAAIAAQVQVRARELLTAWHPDQGGFATRLSADGDDTPGNPSLRMAIRDVVNGVIFILQDVTDAKLGRPLGLKSGGTPQPDDVESRFSANARADILDNLRGVSAVYLGQTESDLGLTDVVAPLNPDLDQSIRIELQASIDAIAALDQPLVSAVVDAPDPVTAARDTVRDLRRLFEADLAGLLGVSVSLSDNDGD